MKRQCSSTSAGTSSSSSPLSGSRNPKGRSPPTRTDSGQRGFPRRWRWDGPEKTRSSPLLTDRENTHMNGRRCLLALTFIAVVGVPSPGRAQPGNSRVFGELLKRIPEQSNVLMLVNVDGLFDSPMGRRENWRQEALANHRGRLGLAADVSKVAVAVDMDYHSMQERWKIGIVQL